jgi:hypothetical protein
MKQWQQMKTLWGKLVQEKWELISQSIAKQNYVFEPKINFEMHKPNECNCTSLCYTKISLWRDALRRQTEL